MSNDKKRTIWKFPLEIVDEQTIWLPQGSEFRLLADQGGTFTLWYEVDPEADKEERRIVIVGTGHPVPAGLLHLGSALQGSFVWHVYVVPSLREVIGRLI